MSLQTIRESYSKFITALNDAGVKVNESQKKDLDSFILAIESKMTKQREAAIKATKKIVTENLESEYKAIFESIMKHMNENSELASKIQDKVTSINESKKIATKVDEYLSMYVESVLPKKDVVDYDRLQKLEKIHESLKDILVCNEDAVETKKASLQESFNKDKKALETQIAKLQAKLDESSSTNKALEKKIDSFKASQLLESKVRDLPDFEARQIKKQLAESTSKEIEENFEKILEKVQDDVKKADVEMESSIEEEVKDIVEADDATTMRENDILKNRNHNAHISEADDCYIQIDILTDKYDDNGDYLGQMSDQEFKKMISDAARQYHVNITIDTMNGLGGDYPLVSVTGPEQNVKKLYEEWYCKGDVSNHDSWEDYKSIFSEDDILDGRNHNAHVEECDSKKKGSPAELDDVELGESEMIDADMMKMWCEGASRINTDLVRGTSLI